MDKQQFNGRAKACSEVSDKPLVSVIMPFLNARWFIEEAVESVFAQTYERWELLLVDDGSTDGSTAVALQYAELYPRKVRYLQHEFHQNRGVATSRNLGVTSALGVYVALLDADDVFLPSALEEQIAIMEHCPDAGMVYGLSQWWYSWTENPLDPRVDFLYELGVSPNTLIRPPKLLVPFFFRQEAAIPCPSSVLVRREVMDRIGGFESDFRGAFGVYEDQAFLSKVCLAAPVFASDRCWSRYRQHPSSACHVAERNGEEYSARRFFLDWLAGYLSEMGVEDAEIWKALRKEEWRCRHPFLSQLLGQGQLRLRQLSRSIVR